MLLGTADYGSAINRKLVKISRINDKLRVLRHFETGEDDQGHDYERQAMRAASRALDEALLALSPFTDAGAK